MENVILTSFLSFIRYCSANVILFIIIIVCSIFRLVEYLAELACYVCERLAGALSNNELPNSMLWLCESLNKECAKKAVRPVLGHVLWQVLFSISSLILGRCLNLSFFTLFARTCLFLK